MILSDPHGRPATARTGGGATLDALFRRAVMRRPDAVALVDPSNCEHFTDGTPRRLTYAQADRMVSAIAGSPFGPRLQDATSWPAHVDRLLAAVEAARSMAADSSQVAPRISATRQRY